MNTTSLYLEAVHFNNTYVCWDAVACLHLHHIPHTQVLCADDELLTITPHNGMLTWTR